MKQLKKSPFLALTLALMMALAACGSGGTEDTTSTDEFDGETNAAENTSPVVVEEDDILEEEADGPSEEILSALISDSTLQVGTEIITLEETTVSAFLDAGFTIQNDEFSPEYLIYGEGSGNFDVAMGDTSIHFLARIPLKIL